MLQIGSALIIITKPDFDFGVMHISAATGVRLGDREKLLNYYERVLDRYCSLFLSLSLHVSVSPAVLLTSFLFN